MQNVKIFKSKKAINDVSIVTIILFIFIGTGVIMPFVNSEFDVSGTNINTDSVADDLVSDQLEDTSSIGIGDILRSVGKMFFWTFGDLPFWLDIIFVVLRVILLFILIRNFTPFISGGG